jgi:DNA integrity scanning protein DisA with diadenylate cyclase activity
LAVAALVKDVDSEKHRFIEEMTSNVDAMQERVLSKIVSCNIDAEYLSPSAASVVLSKIVSCNIDAEYLSQVRPRRHHRPHHILGQGAHFVVRGPAAIYLAHCR